LTNTSRVVIQEGQSPFPRPIINQITKVAFKYDAQDRIQKIGDKVFYYGANGKVAYSRLATEYKGERLEMKYIERLSYYWDSQGRLKEVYLDSLYQKSRYLFPVEETIGTGNENESMMGGVLLASYSYEGTHRKPFKIKYRRIMRSMWGQVGSIGLEEEIHYRYEGNDVAASRLSGYLIGPLPIDPTPSGNRYNLDVLYTYISNPNYLSKVYEQLGFHPFDLSTVVPEHSVATVRTEIDVDLANMGTDADLPGIVRNGHSISLYYTDLLPEPKTIFIEDNNGMDTYTYRFNDTGWSVEITGNIGSIYGKTIIRYE